MLMVSWTSKLLGVAYLPPKVLCSAVQCRGYDFCNGGYDVWQYMSLGHDSISSILYSYSYYRFDMTVEEAIDLGKRAIVHAVHRDAYSGGINNGMVMVQFKHA